MTKSTRDYSIFKKNKCNRNISEHNVTSIMKSISFKNLLEFKPIIVNEDMEVLDGQHRLEAAKRLGVEIYYVVERNLKTSDIPLLNIQKKWTLDDYLNHFIESGNENYKSFYDFKEKYKIHTRTCMSMVGNEKTTFSDFKNGMFKFQKSMFDSCVENMEKLNIIISYIDSKFGGMKADIKYIRSSRFIVGLFNFLSIKSVDFETFLKKIQMRVDMVRHCPTVTAYCKMFKMIYNYRNRNPIELDKKELNDNSFVDKELELQF